MDHSSEPGGGVKAKEVLREGLLVLIIGGLVALAANFLSPRGLSLTRDYFPGAQQPPLPAQTNTVPSNTNVLSVAELASAQIKAKGLQVADHDLVVQLFRDPRRDQELIVFVDARNEQHYQEGHIPGAFLFDHYRQENYLPALLPVFQTAQTIVVYCTGGNCEDSEFAALMLREAGVTKEKLFVYPGGITEWQTKGQPLETGLRNSGTLRDKK